MEASEEHQRMSLAVRHCLSAFCLLFASGTFPRKLLRSVYGVRSKPKLISSCTWNVAQQKPLFLSIIQSFLPIQMKSPKNKRKEGKLTFSIFNCIHFSVSLFISSTNSRVLTPSISPTLLLGFP